VSLVTVVIPTHNRTAFLRDAIESVRRQSFTNIEILIVDDASVPPLTEVLADAPGGEVRVIRHSDNRGPGESRRTGVAAARGDYIAFLDDDDVFDPRLLETAVRVLERDRSIGLFCCDGLLIDEQGSPLPGGKTFNRVQAAIHGYPLRTGPRSLEDVFLWPTVGIGFVVRRAVFADVAYPMHRWLEDYRFQLEVAASGWRVYYHHEPIASYRMHGHNASAPNPMMCREMVDCLEDARRRFAPLRQIGARARRRVAQARMDFAISSLRDGDIAQGLRSLGGALAAHPAQGVALLRFGQRWLAKRSGTVPLSA